MTTQPNGGSDPPVTGTSSEQKHYQMNGTPIPDEHNSFLQKGMSNLVLPSPPSSPTPSSSLRKSSVSATELSTAPTAPTAPTTVSANAEDDLVAKILQFLSSATPSTLAVIAGGLVVATYFVLGRLGLLLIGAFSGILSFLACESRHPEISRAVRAESGVDALQRLWVEMRNDALVRNKDGTDGKEQHGDISPTDDEYQLMGFEDFGPDTRTALNDLVDAVVHNYVSWWYSPIVPTDRSFPLTCRKTLSSFLLSVSNALSRKRPADAFLDFLTNSSSIVIVFLSELSAALAELPVDGSVNAPDAVFRYLGANPDSSLANLLNGRQQASKLRMVSQDLLAFLDRSTHGCNPARVFLREILAGVCLESTLQTCSKPEWINGWIVHLLEAGEPDLSHAIDIGMQTGPDANNNQAFADIDGNLGNVSIAKPGSRSSMEAADGGRKRDSAHHQKKLSKAKEEMEEAMEEMKRMNAMIAEEEERRAQSATAPATSVSASVTPAPAIAATANDNANPVRYSAERQAPANATERNSRDIMDPTGSSSDGQDSSLGLGPGGQQANRDFTSFDQIMPPARDESCNDSSETPKLAELTLRNATLIIYDDADNDKGRVRNKPTGDYLIQIEPASSAHPGWMIARKYSDFETLHEILRRIATISGATAFTEQHSTLPLWKVHTKASLRGELERYLRDACWHPALADSEGMRRFLDRDSGHQPTASKGLNWENVGKGMLDVLTTAPKGAVEGGKAVVGGMTGVLGNIGLGQLGRRSMSSTPTLSELTTNNSNNTVNTINTINTINSRPSISTSSRAEAPYSPALSRVTRDSLDSQQSSVISTQPGRIPPMDAKSSLGGTGGGGAGTDGESDAGSRPQSDRWEKAPQSARNSRENSRRSSLALLRSTSSTSIDKMRLPPPPDEMPDDYDAGLRGPDGRFRSREAMLSRQNSRHSSVGRQGSSSLGNVGNANGNGNGNGNGNSNGNGNATGPNPPAKTPSRTRQHSPLTEGETRVAVELLFAVINELYTLSSVWNIRRTLLTAAKSFLLRPGNPSLASIQGLMQKSVLDANTGDAGIAAHLRKLRENVMPTEAERASWPAEMTAEDKEKLRVRARALLIRDGVPAALTGVMGQAATGEALGRVFDCLQNEEVARGLMFGIVLQAVRVVTH